VEPRVIPFPEPATKSEAAANIVDAQLHGDKTYIGRPCKNCGGRQRCIYSSWCTACRKAWELRNHARIIQRKRRDDVNEEQLELDLSATEKCCVCHQDRVCRPVGDDGKPICLRCATAPERLHQTARRFADYTRAERRKRGSQGAPVELLVVDDGKVSLEEPDQRSVVVLPNNAEAFEQLVDIASPSISALFVASMEHPELGVPAVAMAHVVEVDGRPCVATMALPLALLRKIVNQIEFEHAAPPTGAVH